LKIIFNKKIFVEKKAIFQKSKQNFTRFDQFSRVETMWTKKIYDFETNKSTILYSDFVAGKIDEKFSKQKFRKIQDKVLEIRDFGLNFSTFPAGRRQC